MAKKKEKLCPCGSGRQLQDCCRLLISGEKNAQSAEALMRSRYVAYVLKDEGYLLETWHVSTRPSSVELDVAVKWIRLQIIAGSDDHVEFIATYRVQGKASRLHENSRFVNEGGQWFYVEGELERSK